MELRERAYSVLLESGRLAEEDLLARLFQGRVPVALRAGLVGPLLADDRLTRDGAGVWQVAAEPGPGVDGGEFVALAIAATGPRPGRDRLVAVEARRYGTSGEPVVLSVLVRPERRVPRYVLGRLGIEERVLEDAEPLASHWQSLVALCAGAPVHVQEASLVERFLRAEQQALGVAPARFDLRDVTALASSHLGQQRKPTLANLAATLGLGATRLEHPAEEARIIGEVIRRLAPDGQSPATAPAPSGSRPLRDAALPRTLPDSPGVYVLRDEDGRAVYVGKARRLMERVGSYVGRPLGPMRRLEGLVDAVAAVETAPCENELEALVLEARQIAALGPRFNAQRAVHPWRPWLVLPDPPPPPARGKRRRAPVRLGIAAERPASGRALGPFRNERLARETRDLVRQLYELDRWRREDPDGQYGDRLERAWRFLEGDTDAGLAEAHALRACTPDRSWRALVQQVLRYEPRRLVLPADPRQTTFVVVRPDPGATLLEAYLLERARLVAYALSPWDDGERLANDLLAERHPRTDAQDVDVVLRWVGAQREPARVGVLSAADPTATIADLVAEVRLGCEARAARPVAGED